MDDKLEGNFGGNLPARITERDHTGGQESQDPITEVARFSKAVIALSKPIGILVGGITFIITTYVKIVGLAGQVYDDKAKLSNYRIEQLESSVKALHEDTETIKKYLWEPPPKKGSKR